MSSCTLASRATRSICCLASRPGLPKRDIIGDGIGEQKWRLIDHRQPGAPAVELQNRVSGRS